MANKVKTQKCFMRNINELTNIFRITFSRRKKCYMLIVEKKIWKWTLTKKLKITHNPTY